MPDPKLLITCEHAVNHIPERWADVFAAHRDDLESHRGWDPGSLELGKALAADSKAPCIAAQVSRLLVDHNRSPHNRGLWPDHGRSLPEAEKEQILKDYYLPFREQTSRWIAARIDGGERVIHISVHSFTPVLDGQIRDVDIGILYDPGRTDEAFFANLWRDRLSRSCPEFKVRFNVPYRGRSDCHQSTYRAQYPCQDYVAIELEVNQALLSDLKSWRRGKTMISESLREALAESGSDE